MFIWSRIGLLLAVAHVLKSENKTGERLKGETKVDDYHEVSESKVLNWTELAFVLTGFFLILMLGFALAFYCFYRRMKAKQIEVNNAVKLLKGRITVSEDEYIANPLDILYDPKWDLKKHSFCIDESKILGCGEFGIVYKGTISKRNSDVAFKCLKSQGNITHLTSLVSELKLLVYIGQHRNIVEFYGAYTKEIKKGILYVATEYCALGSLKSYLRSNKEQFQQCQVLKAFFQESNTMGCKVFEQADSSNFTIKSLLNWCAEISMAMDYLYSKKVVHRDLAARNILLTEHLTTKLIDFGLSRKMYISDEYVKQGDDPLPWKWLALESLLTNIFNVKTDVWAYGILLWEIFSFGETPYPGMSASREFVTELENGLRNGKPKYASKELYEVMLACWNSDPDLRPSFSSLCLLFQNALQLSSYLVNVEDLKPLGQLECENVEYLQLEDIYIGNNSINDVIQYLISISKSITNLDQILNGLIQFRIISEEESRIVKCEMTDSRQNFKLLTLLFQKGWSAINSTLLDILRTTNNAHCIDDIERISRTLNTKDQSLENARNEFVLQENISSNESQLNHRKIVYLPNGVHFSKKCVVRIWIGIFTSIVICTFILLLSSTVWINPENVRNTSIMKIQTKIVGNTSNFEIQTDNVGNASTIEIQSENVGNTSTIEMQSENVGNISTIEIQTENVGNTSTIEIQSENEGNTSTIEIQTENVKIFEIRKQKLLKFLKSVSDSKTISGLYLAGNKNVAFEKIQRIARVLPGILTTEMPKNLTGVDKWQSFVENTISDWNNHHLVYIRFFLGHPLRVILKDGNETSWNDLIEEKGKRNKLWKISLDALAPFLLQLQTAGVVPIFDLLPYINSDISLWGRRVGLEGSLKLFQITKDYLTQNHGLTSLIWNWSLCVGTCGGDMKRLEDVWPGNNFVDVVSVYMGERKELSITEYQKLLDVVGDKPIGMEGMCIVPSTQLLATQTRWTWFTVDDYFLTNEGYNREENTKRTFESPSVINRGTNQFFNVTFST